MKNYAIRCIYFAVMPLNFEFKARCNDIIRAEAQLKTLKPLFIGEDHQKDTYFVVPFGRLKLREGVIENSLIHYNRSDIAGAKQSSVLLYQHYPDASLKSILTASLGIKTIVEKKRKIYYIENVKFHFDQVEGLGNFLEVEAIDKDGKIGIEQLKNQCDQYAALLEVSASDYIAQSYSDMLLEKNPH
jgi:predicted adenylyl cyclase CyaB